MNRPAHSPASWAQARGGFTLLEMMVALGILATAYVALMQAESASIRLSTYGKQITVATFLAQGLMEETEEELTREGFPDMDDEREGDFEEQGYPSFKWRLAIRKVELPIGEAFNTLLSGMTGDDADKSSPLGNLAGMGNADNLKDMLGGQLGDQLKGQLGGIMGGAGGAGGAGGIAGMMNPDMLKGQVEMLANMLEQALREVQLVVFWDEGGEGKQIVVTTHLVQVPQAGAGGAMQPGAQPGMPGQLNPGGKQGLTPGGKGGRNQGMRPGMAPAGTRGKPISPGGVK